MASDILGTVKSIQSLTQPSAQAYLKFRVGESAQIEADVARLRKERQALLAKQYQVAAGKGGGLANYLQAVSGLQRQQREWEKQILNSANKEMERVGDENARREKLRVITVEQADMINTLKKDLPKIDNPGAIAKRIKQAANGMHGAAGSNKNEKMPAILNAIGVASEEVLVGEPLEAATDYLNNLAKIYSKGKGDYKDYPSFYRGKLGHREQEDVIAALKARSVTPPKEWRRREKALEAFNPLRRGITKDTPPPQLNDSITKTQNWFGSGYQVYEAEDGQPMVRKVPDTSEGIETVQQFAAGSVVPDPSVDVSEEGVPLAQAVAIVDQRGSESLMASKQYNRALKNEIADIDQRIQAAEGKKKPSLTSGELQLLVHPFGPPGFREAPPMRLLKRYAKFGAEKAQRAKLAAAPTAEEGDPRAQILDLDPGINVIKAVENQMADAYRDYQAAGEGSPEQWAAAERMNRAAEAVIEDAPDSVKNAFKQALGEKGYGTLTLGAEYLPDSASVDYDAVGTVFSRVQQNPELYDLGFLDNFIDTPSLSEEGSEADHGIELSQMHLLLKALDQEASQGDEYDEDVDPLGSAGRKLLVRLDEIVPEGTEINKGMEAYQEFATNPETKTELIDLASMARQVNPGQFEVKDRAVDHSRYGGAFTPQVEIEMLKSAVVYKQPPLADPSDDAAEAVVEAAGGEAGPKGVTPAKGAPGLPSSLGNLSDKQKEMVNIIRREFHYAGFDDNMAAAAIANAWHESKLDPAIQSKYVHPKTRKREQSWGLFQLNTAKPGFGGWRLGSPDPMPHEELINPVTNTRRIIEVIQGEDGQALRDAWWEGADVEALSALFTTDIEKPEFANQRAKERAPDAVKFSSMLADMGSAIESERDEAATPEDVDTILTDGFVDQSADIDLPSALNDPEFTSAPRTAKEKIREEEARFGTIDPSTGIITPKGKADLDKLRREIKEAITDDPEGADFILGEYEDQWARIYPGNVDDPETRNIISESEKAWRDEQRSQIGHSLWKRGRYAYDVGWNKEAVKRLTNAFNVSRRTEILLDIARAHAKDGNKEEAKKSLDRYKVEGPKEDQERPDNASAVQSLEQFLGAEDVDKELVSAATVSTAQPSALVAAVPESP